MYASWLRQVLSEGYGHGGPGVYLGDGQTEAYLKDMGKTGLASVWATVDQGFPSMRECRHDYTVWCTVSHLRYFLVAPKKCRGTLFRRR